MIRRQEETISSLTDRVMRLERWRRNLRRNSGNSSGTSGSSVYGSTWSGSGTRADPVVESRCRASVRRGTHLRTFRLFARTLVGLIRMYFVSIGGSYLILLVRRYSSRTCSRDRSYERTTIISRHAVLSRYSLFFPLRSQFPLASYSTAFAPPIIVISLTPNNSRVPQTTDDPSESLS